jgi:hypothetical protein
MQRWGFFVCKDHGPELHIMRRTEMSASEAGADMAQVYSYLFFAAMPL